MTKRERDRRRREKHQAQKMRRRENVIKDVERRLSGSVTTAGVLYVSRQHSIEA